MEANILCVGGFCLQAPVRLLCEFKKVWILKGGGITDPPPPKKILSSCISRVLIVSSSITIIIIASSIWKSVNSIFHSITNSWLVDVYVVHVNYGSIKALETKQRHSVIWLINNKATISLAVSDPYHILYFNLFSLFFCLLCNVQINMQRH